jgi:hypothetical protein
VNLFNLKTLNRHIKPSALPADHLIILEAWADLIRSGRVYTLKEIALHGQFAAKIIEGVLGYHGPAGGADYTVATEQSILRGSVDLALGRFGGQTPEIHAPFELKGADTRDLDAIMPGRNKTPVQQAWEYAMNARGVKWVLVSNMIELRLYGFGEGTTSYETFRLDRLTDPEEYARFMLLLSAENLLSGRTSDLLQQSRAEDRDITDSLYQDYKALRLKLIGAVQAADPTIIPLDSIAVAQKILDRVLFIAFAEDTGLLPDNTLSQAFITRDPYNPRPVWNNFCGLFSAIDQGSEALRIPRYNGGLFRQDDSLNALTLSDDVCEGFKALGGYDFASEVSVTVLGHIFEQSIADVERLQAQARGEETEVERVTGTTGRRKRDGVVYTPDYIARFIVAETLGAHLEEAFVQILRAHAKAGADLSDYAAILWRRKSAELEAWKAYRDRLKTLRIVDPACGSGVFLIMAFDFLKAELTRVNDKIAKLRGEDQHTQDLLDPDSEILTNNLFGVDVNVESIEIAKLSLWIKTARRGKVLDSLSGNFRVGDSLIEDSNYAYLNHAFTWETAFPTVHAEGGFDVVLGNPPYVRMEFLKALKPYLEKRYEVVSDRADLYCYFFERGLRLLKPGGRLGYISSSTFLRNGSARPLREYLLREATIEALVDFGDLQIFDGVATLPIVLTVKRGPAPKDHELRFWQVDALPENNFQATWAKAAGPYPQDALGAGSWELENPNLRALRDKIKKGRRTLKEVYGAPYRGVVTGLNRAFVIDGDTKDRICAEDAKSADLIKPLLEGKDLKRWRAEPRGLWLIYIPKNRVSIDDYPAIRGWLLPFKEQLEKRATTQKWFELQQAQEAFISHFETTKLVYSEFNRRYFSFVGPEFYFNNKLFMMASGDMALLALLQSSLYWFLFVSMAPQVIGGSRELRSQYVETVPIPTWTGTSHSDLVHLSEQATKAASARLEIQKALTRRIPDLSPGDRRSKLTNRLQEWWTLPDFSAFRAEVKKQFKADIPLEERSTWEDWITRDRAEIARLSGEIAKAEAQIDNIVYKLFDLSPDEILQLERAVSP